MADVLAGVAATFSKSPRFWSGDPDWQPQTIDYGRGAYVWGSDRRKYLDWVSGLGAVILGHPDGQRDSTPANRWAERVTGQVWDGASFSLPHGLECSVAEKLANRLSLHVPGWHDQPLGVRWGKTGSDACAMAVRLARAVTGRAYILSVGYHGWHDMFVSTTPPAWGVGLHEVGSIPFGNLASLEWLLVERAKSTQEVDRVGAIIIEQPPQPVILNYWRQIRELCNEYHALLILDEVVTGLRYALGGAAEWLQVEPDIICMGKALGNGLPISCIIGRREYFDWFSRDDPVFVSSTGFGEVVSLAAADAVLDCWGQAEVDHIWEIGTELITGLRDAGYIVTGYPPVSLFQHPTPAHHAFFVREMAKRGILMNRPNIPNLAHTTTDVQETVRAATEVMAAMHQTDVEREMTDKLPRVLFRRR